MFCCAFLALAMASPAQCDDLRGFWSKDSVIQYESPARENSSSNIQFGNHPRFADQMKQASLAKQRAEAKGQQHQTSEPDEQFQQPPAAVPVSQPDQQPAQAQDTPLTREQIIAKYGPPEKQRYIKAQKEAPPEMQALIDALNSGDKELAWGYAVAMARRTEQLQDVVGKATQIQLLAMEALGMRPEAKIDEENQQVSPERAAFRALMEKTKQERLSKKLNVDNALKAESADPSDTWTTGQGAQAQPVPVDPAGKVKLLVFFNESDPETTEMVESLKTLRNKVPSDAQFSVFGLTKRTYAPAGLKKLGANTGFPYPLLNGEALSQDLQIVTYPTYVFVALTSKQTYRLEGKRTADEVEKVVRLMKGGQ
jgi:hypothetical protein